MNKRRKQIIKENEISMMYTFSLGKIPQKVLIEGKRKDLPVVISLHGGPGTPVPFSAGCRGLFPMFTDHFIMVYWDQLGCGINNRELKPQFCVEAFTEMTIDLIAEIRKLFPDNKLILFGMSWGSVLALKALQKAWKDVDAAVIWGQVLRKLLLNDEVYKTLEINGLSHKKMQKIRAITPEHFRESDMRLLTGSIRRYTDGYSNKNGLRAPIGSIICGLLTSPDYQLKDFKAIMINAAAADAHLWTELLQMDLTNELSAVKVPYYILQGDTDIVTSTSDIVKAVASSGNSFLSCRIVKDSGHIPGKEGMDAVYETLVTAAKA